MRTGRKVAEMAHNCYDLAALQKHVVGIEGIGTCYWSVIEVYKKDRSSCETVENPGIDSIDSWCC